MDCGGEQRRRARFARVASGQRRFGRRLLAPACLLACVLGAVQAPGSAAAAGRALVGTIHATAKCPLSQPAGLAVNEATGDIYVVERQKRSIERFSAAGECIAIWPAAALEGIAVDNSHGPAAGDVYAIGASEKGSEARTEVRRFSAEGAELRAIKRFRVNGKEWPAVFEELGERGELLGVAVDGAGKLWVYGAEEIYAFNGDEHNTYASAIEPSSNCSALPGFAMMPDATRFYLGREPERKNEGCQETEEDAAIMAFNGAGEPAGQPAYAGQLDGGPTHGVAVDPTDGTVYTNDGTDVSSFDATGRFEERFGAEGPQPLRGGSAIAVDGATHQVLVTDAVAQTVDVYGPPVSASAPKPEPEAPQLPDGRAWQLVSPPQKHGSAIFPDTGDAGLVQAAADGSAIAYDSNAPIVAEPPVDRAPEPSVNLSRREPGGWVTQDLGTPRTKAVGYSAGQGTEYRYFAEDLSSAFVTPAMGVFEADEAPLSPTPAQTTIYRRDLAQPAGACEPLPSTCYQPLVSSLDPLASGYGAQLKFLQGTPDGRHAVFYSEVPIALNAETAEGAHPLFEWSAGEGAGTLQVVNTPPAGEAGRGAGAKLGEVDVTSRENGENMRHAISDDGSRVIWASSGRLYLRDMVANETLRLDVPREGAPASEEGGAVFRIANAAGTRIFFTDEQPLTANSTSEEGQEPPEGQADLYSCEVVTREGHLACDLTDLTTAVAASGEAAAVQQVVGASEDGTYVYFVADGVLASGAGRGHCGDVSEEEEQSKHLPARSCNLYVEHLGPAGWEAPRFIAALSTADRPDWQAATARHGLTARVSPDGRFLAFMSSSSLTGYDNVDASPQAAGARDQELYLYDEASNELTCASCNPTGARPHGVLDQIHSGEGNGLVIDRPFIWEGQWLAGDISGWTSNVGEYGTYLARNLSDSGRLFFNSADALVPAAKNGKTDVYEYEPLGVGSCHSPSGCIALLSSGTSSQESAFVDASASGEDAFIYTAAPLQPTIDRDGAFDIYDVQVCRESAPCLTPAVPEASSCTREPGEAACRTAPGEAPALPPAPPTAAGGAGNSGTLAVLPYKAAGASSHVHPRLSSRQRLANALRACRRQRRTQRRRSCERAARRRYPVRRAARRGRPGAHR